VQAAEAVARAALVGGGTALATEEQEPPGEPMPDSPVPEAFAALRWPRENGAAGSV
jgi:hypothetical protein